jgi:hypothetical protein
MQRNIIKNICAAGILSCVLLTAQIPAAAQTTLTIGGFDSTRGGVFSLAEGSALTELRSSIATAFPYATITASPTLTTTYLNSISVLLISSVTSEDIAPFTPLSTAEQEALVSFVERGGIALLFVDNDVNSPSAASNSFVGPFGIHATGNTGTYTEATAAGSSLPVLNGPFENISQYQTVVDGWFDVTGSSVVLATIPGVSGGTVAELLYLTKSSSCTVYKGIVLASGDSSMLDTGFSTIDDQNLVLNTIALAIPVSAVTLSPTATVGGHTTTANTVTLGFAAPGSGIVVNLTSSNPAVASVPATVTVAGGSTVSPTFSIVTSAVSANTKVTITAANGPVSKTAALTVVP